MKRAKVKKTSKPTKKTVKPSKAVPTKQIASSKSTSDIETAGTVKSKVMTCIVTGLERRVSKAGIIKGNKKFGGPVPFAEHYVSNEAKRLLRQRVSPEEVQKQLRPAKLKPFSIDKQVLARLKLLKKPKNQKRISVEEAKDIAYKWTPKEKRSYSSLKEYIIDNTKNGSCIAPQLYLNSDRCCDNCKYSQDCLSTAKTFSKKYKP